MNASPACALRENVLHKSVPAADRPSGRTRRGVAAHRAAAPAGRRALRHERGAGHHDARHRQSPPAPLARAIRVGRPASPRPPPSGYCPTCCSGSTGAARSCSSSRSAGSCWWPGWCCSSCWASSPPQGAARVAVHGGPRGGAAHRRGHGGAPGAPRPGADRRHPVQGALVQRLRGPGRHQGARRPHPHRAARRRGAPEAGQRFADKLAPLIEPMGYRLRSSVDEDEDDVNGVTAAVAARLGDVSFQVGHNTSTFPDVQITGGTARCARGGRLPLGGPGAGQVPSGATTWRCCPRGCAGPTPAIVAGDFNATLDHSMLRAGMAGCGDAAAQRGDGLAPTWGPTATHPGHRPADRPRARQPRHRQAESFRVVDLPAQRPPRHPRDAPPALTDALAARAPSLRPGQRMLRSTRRRALSGSPPRGRGPTRRTSAPGAR